MYGFSITVYGRGLSLRTCVRPVTVVPVNCPVDGRRRLSAEGRVGRVISCVWVEG